MFGYYRSFFFTEGEFILFATLNVVKSFITLGLVELSYVQSGLEASKMLRLIKKNMFTDHNSTLR